jgi:hypothetical protein
MKRILMPRPAFPATLEVEPLIRHNTTIPSGTLHYPKYEGKKHSKVITLDDMPENKVWKMIEKYGQPSVRLAQK